MSSSSRHSLRYVRETVRGTTPATPAFKAFRQTGVSLGMTKETLQSEEGRQDRQIADVRHGARAISGDVKFELSFGTYDDMLEAALMGTWDATEDDVLHAGLVRRYFTLEREFADLKAGNKFMRFTGCEVNTMELQVNANAMVTGSFAFIGADMVTAPAAIAGATYAAPTTSSPVDAFSGSLTEGGVPVAVITEITLSLTNNLEARYVVGSKTSIDPSVGRSNVTANITAFFEDASLLNKFIEETESSLSFDLPDTAGNILRITLPRIKYMGGQPDTEGEGPITLSMPIQALLDPVTGTNIIVERIPATP